MEVFKEKIKSLRQERNLPLRIVAGYIDVDQAILSKIERGHRMAKREDVVKLAEFFQIDKNELLVLWLSDKLVYELADEETALSALQLAEEKIEYLSSVKLNKDQLIVKLKEGIKRFSKIKKAWIFGSLSRSDARPESDVDVAIETDPTFSYFDLAEVQHELENTLHRKVDIGFIDGLKSDILRSVKPDLKLIYER